MKNFKVGVVWSMVALRVLLCPVMVWGAETGWNGIWLAAIVVIALVDDIYDGVAARRWDCDTPTMRMSDSLTDTVFISALRLPCGFANPMSCGTTGF